MSITAMRATDAHIGTNIRVLMARDGIESIEDLAIQVAMTSSTLYRRMKEGGWKAYEVEVVADHFGLKAGDLYSDPAGIRPTQAKRGPLMGRLGGLAMRRDGWAA